MEVFESNDLVSWSSSDECDHVFHHACIKTWLLHHECCPYCRVCIRPVDKRNADIEPMPTASRGVSLGFRGNKKKRIRNWGNDQLKDMAVQRHERLASTYFCVKEGLVILEQPLNVGVYNVKSTVDTQASNTTSFSRNTLQQFLASDVPRNELMALRTHPKSIRSTSDVVVTMTSPTVPHVETGASMEDATAMLAQHDAVDFTTANAIMDIETTMKELPVISDEVADTV